MKVKNEPQLNVQIALCCVVLFERAKREMRNLNEVVWEVGEGGEHKR